MEHSVRVYNIPTHFLNQEIIVRQTFLNVSPGNRLGPLLPIRPSSCVFKLQRPSISRHLESAIHSFRLINGKLAGLYRPMGHPTDFPSRTLDDMYA